MRVSYIVFSIILLMIGVVAFTSEQVFGDPEQRATEYVVLSQTIAVDQTQQPTVQALQQTVESVAIIATQAAQAADDLLNAQATQTSLILTPVVYLPTATPTIAPFAAEASTTFSDTAIAGAINESNGCAVDLRQTFSISGPNDPTKIYLTTVGNNLRAGTLIQTRWYREDDRSNAFESVTWSPSIDHERICIYFWLESSNIPFASGLWTVELVVDGSIVETLDLLMCEVGDTCQ